MGKQTKIEWCDSTVNPTDFQCCGCELWNKQRRDCYAGQFAERYRGAGAFDQPVVLKPGKMAAAARWSDLRGTDRPAKPWLNGRPRVIFIGDMADTLQPGVPFRFLMEEIFDVVTSQAGSRHIWMWLTKQAKRMVQFQEFLHEVYEVHWPSNLWPGVSVTSNRTAWRVDELLKIHSTHRFISYEPAWEFVDFSPWTCQGYKDCEGFTVTDPSEKIELIIGGGQSGRGAGKTPFNVQWASDLIDLCETDQVNCFLKQLGSNCITDNANLYDWPETVELVGEGEGFAAARAKFKHAKGGDPAEWPPELRVRQFPEV